jgi:hypothetical protein
MPNDLMQLQFHPINMRNSRPSKINEKNEPEDFSILVRFTTNFQNTYIKWNTDETY